MSYKSSNMMENYFIKLYTKVKIDEEFLISLCICHSEYFVN